MIQPSCNSCLGEKASSGVDFRNSTVVDLLERYPSIQALIVSPKDFSHPAGA